MDGKPSILDQSQSEFLTNTLKDQIQFSGMVQLECSKSQNSAKEALN